VPIGGKAQSAISPTRIVYAGPRSSYYFRLRSDDLCIHDDCRKVLPLLTQTVYDKTRKSQHFESSQNILLPFAQAFPLYLLIHTQDKLVVEIRFLCWLESDRLTGFSPSGRPYSTILSTESELQRPPFRSAIQIRHVPYSDAAIRRLWLCQSGRGTGTTAVSENNAPTSAHQREPSRSISPIRHPTTMLRSHNNLSDTRSMSNVSTKVGVPTAPESSPTTFQEAQVL
jgi:hypothetical protein